MVWDLKVLVGSCTGMDIKIYTLLKNWENSQNFARLDRRFGYQIFKVLEIVNED